jgi:hypothetical protein
LNEITTGTTVVETAASLSKKIENSWNKIQELRSRLTEMCDRGVGQNATTTDSLEAFMAEIQEKAQVCAYVFPSPISFSMRIHAHLSSFVPHLN